MNELEFPRAWTGPWRLDRDAGVWRRSYRSPVFGVVVEHTCPVNIVCQRRQRRRSSAAPSLPARSLEELLEQLSGRFLGARGWISMRRWIPVLVLWAVALVVVSSLATRYAVESSAPTLSSSCAKFLGAVDSASVEADRRNRTDISNDLAHPWAAIDVWDSAAQATLDQLARDATDVHGDRSVQSMASVLQLDATTVNPGNPELGGRAQREAALDDAVAVCAGR